MAKKTTEETSGGTATMEPPVKEKKPKKTDTPTDGKVEYKVGEEYQIDPVDMVVDHEANSREGLHTTEDVEATAKSMKKFGQLQPVLTTVDADGKPELVAGYKRYSAAMSLNKDLKPGDEGRFKLRCYMIDAKSELAKLLLDIESNRTTAISPVDDWKAHNRLREAGKTNAWIAKHYGVDPSYVSHLQKLDKVSEATRTRIKGGECSLKMGRELARFSLDAQDEIITIALAIAKKNWEADKETTKKPFDGKLTTNAVGEAIRRYAEEPPAPEGGEGGDQGAASGNGEATGTDAGNGEAAKGTEGGTGEPAKPTSPRLPSPALTLKEVKQFFKENCLDLVGESEEPMRRLGQIMFDLFDGKRQKTIVDRLTALVNGDDDPVPQKGGKKTKE